jgi:hypothetical protein
MKESLEFATAVLDTVSFVLVTPDLVGKERLTDVGARIRRSSAGLANISEWGGTIGHLIAAMGMISLSYFLIFPGAVILQLILHSPKTSPFLATEVVALFGLASILFLWGWVPIIGAATYGVLKRYNFNGVLLAFGALTFLVSRALIIHDTWPH